MQKLLLTLAITITACGAITEKKPSPYFEGLVESTVTISSGSPESDSFYYSMVGRFVTTYIKDSFVARTYYDENKIIIRRELLRSDSLRLYQTRPKSDTMLVTDLSNDYYYSNISVKEMPSKKVMGRDCKGVRLTEKVQSNFLSTPSIATSYYYLDTAHFLNPGLNHRIKFGSFDKVFGMYPFLTMQIEQHLQDVVVVFTAFRVSQGKVDPIMFDIPEHKVRVNPYLLP